jgi:hypothetical protein
VKEHDEVVLLSQALNSREHDEDAKKITYVIKLHRVCVWTIIPAIILIQIALPSLLLEHDL